MDKDKIFNMQRFIKEEKPSGQRLQSIRLPRDLSLGGTKQSKKHFVPNLNAVRNKDRAKEVIRKTEQKRRQTIRQNGVNRSDERYVQSSGIFSEGAAGEFRRSHHSGERWSSGSSKENDYMSMPTIKKNSWNVEKKNEESVLDEIMKQEEDDEEEKLPFKPITWNESVLKEIKIPIKPEMTNGNIKTELEDSVIEPTFKNLKLKQSVFPNLPREYYNQDLCSSNNPMLTLWNLPDSFAGKGLSEDPNCKQLFDYCLNNMTEGHIGKLVIRQSGRVEVYIGRVKYDLDSMELDSCVEDIVTLDAEDKRGTASVLGQVQNRFLLNPNWNSLLL